MCQFLRLLALIDHPLLLLLLYHVPYIGERMELDSQPLGGLYALRGAPITALCVLLREIIIVFAGKFRREAS